MTGYREGQLVRWEWPDGTGCTDTLVDVASDLIGRRFRLDPHHLIRDGRVVTILAAPKPDEPTGLYAVVRDPEDEDPTPWVRDGVAPGRPWWRFAKGQPLVCRQWADFSDRVEVLFPGVES